MKKTLLVFMLILIMALPVFARAPQKSISAGSRTTALDTDTYIDVNSMLMLFSNDGAFATDLGGLFGKTDGLYFPYTGTADIESGFNTNSVIYAAGLWIGGVDAATNDTLICLAEYSEEYVPGPMADGTFIPDNSSFRVYKLYSDSLADNPNDDYNDWPANQGAPVKEDGTPDMIGDQMLWTVYNDADASAHTNNSGRTDPMGIEVQQTVFGFDRTGSLANIIFLKFKVMNKGGKNLENVYVSLWSDPDLGDAGDDLDGCDTALSLGYCYNGNNDDGSYGSNPPAVGFDFFQGPLEFTGDDADTALMWGTTFPQYRNLPMSSFAKYINGTDPQNKTETYNYMQGLNADGSDYTDDQGVVTTFHFAGDPVTGIGSLDFDPADRRFMVTTGPFDFAPGDSTEILAAIVVGQGSDRLSSITLMKEIDASAQRIYESGFNPPPPPAKPIVTVTNLDQQVVLAWTNISEENSGDYPFEGYTVHQGESPSGPWKMLGNFDVVNDISVVVDTFFNSVLGEPFPVIVKEGKNTGLQRHFEISQDAFSGAVLFNNTEYYFKVDAYSVDQTKLAGEQTLTSQTIVTAKPSKPTIGTEVSTEFGQEIEIDLSRTSSDGTVTATIIDPLALTGHTYEVIFEELVSGWVWHLLDVTTGQVILADQTNQAGDSDYAIADGFLLKVIGPAGGVGEWDAPSGTRRFTWAGGADGFGFEGFEGAIGWGGPGDTHGFGSHDPVPIPDHVDILLKLATVDEDGNFDVNDENVSYGYRYLRGAGPPAIPEFAPFIIDPNSGSYGFQIFEPNVPLSAWNVSVDPPQRLTVGFLENNTEGGLVDGMWFPGSYIDYDNVSGSGPREWLWIYLDEYSETANPDYMLNAIDDPMPILYWILVARRGSVPFSPGGTGEDEFSFNYQRINAAVDTFSFVAEAPVVADASEELLNDIKVVPNPYYLFSGFDNSVFNRNLKFTNLPEKCTIRIFSISGDIVAKVEKDDSETETTWDMLNTNGVPIASGIYVYVVEAEGFGQKIGKMAIFVEEEQLGQY